MTWQSIRINGSLIELLHPSWWRSSGPPHNSLNCNECGNMCGLCSAMQTTAMKTKDPTEALNQFNDLGVLQSFHSAGHPAPKPPQTMGDRKGVSQVWNAWMGALDTVQDSTNLCDNCRFETIIKMDSDALEKMKDDPK